MSSPTRRLAHILTLALTAALLLTAVTPGATLAQDPPPPAAEDPAPTPPPAGDEELVLPPQEPGQGDPAAGAGEQVGERYVPPAVEPAAPPEATPDAASDLGAAVPEGYIPPAALAELSPSELAQLDFPEQIQGDIKLDLVVTPGRARAGDDLTYTYIFTNTRPTAASNFVIKARWTNFNLTNSGNIWQFCKVADCPATATVNATVTRDSISATEAVYRVTSTLEPGQAGSFEVVLGTRSDRFPRTGQAPLRPAGSGVLAASSASPAISEDNANALFVGPVFVIGKARTSPATAYYARPDQIVEFTITVGNATAPGDRSGGVVRADAEPATNISLTDQIPGGSEFVSADGSPTVEGNIVRWTIPGPLRPGESIALKVRFRKLDVNVECGRLNNNVYSVSSDEMPIQSGSSRYRVSGQGLGVDIRTPVVIQSVTSSVRNPIFGTETTLTIRVQSYWDQPIPDLEVRYAVQSNAFYVPGQTPSGPPPVSAPSGATPGGDVVWRFDMPAGSVTTPATQDLTLVVRGAYTQVVAGGTGVATIVPPAGIPSACIRSLGAFANFQPRLFASKVADPAMPLDNGRYLVTRGSRFTYLIRIENRGVEEARGIRMVDRLPAGNGANFSYDQAAPATLNGQPFPPAAFQNGGGGSITWEGISVPAGATAEIRFSLIVDGLEYVDQCNTFDYAIGDGSEPVRETNNNRLCVRLSPPITLTKTASRTTVDGNNPGDNREVVFTLTYVNRDSQAYSIGLYDFTGEFDYVRMDDGNPPPSIEGNNLRWPSISVPPDGSYSVRFVARLNPPRCENRSYFNELGFVFSSPLGGDPYVVVTVPPTRVAVQYLCGLNGNLLSYTKTSDVQVVSTRDRHLYTLNVRNENANNAMTNVDIIDVLPPGFTYVGMGPSSRVTTQPAITTRGDGRVQLAWRVPSLAANTTTNVQFFARSGEIVGPFSNWLRATADNLGGVKDCNEAGCRNYSIVEEEGERRIYATRSIRVEPLATVEPSIDRATECAASGENRTYQIALVNTNRVAYSNTVVTATIPLGLHFDGFVGATPPARIVAQDERGTVLRWEGLVLPQKPNNAASSQLTLRVRLRVGQVWGALQPRVEANSPDGSLPKKDGILDPTVQLCAPGGPALGLDASKLRLVPREEFLYIVSAINPGGAPLSLGLEDTLNPKLTYVGPALGPAPAVAGQQLSWSGLTVPAATQQDGPGTLTIVFRVRLNDSAVVGDIIPNRVTVSPGGPELNGDRAIVEVEVVDPRTLVYLPMVRR